MPSTEQLLVDIRARINYESFYSELLGDRLRPSRGREMRAVCPFHDDNDPSLSINRDTGLWMCRVPSCPGHAGGDFIAFVRRIMTCGFPDAVRLAADRVGVDIGESATARFTRIARENAAVDEDALLDRYAISLRDVLTPPQFIDSAIVDAFHRQLAEDVELTNERLNWLFNNRGIDYDTVIRYKIGHDGDRYTIPIYDTENRCVNIRRYRADAEQKMISWREGFGAARLFPASAVRGLPVQNSFVYIMEGEWDCLLARQHGLNAITSTGGAGSWNPEWNATFADYNVVICYDNDDAGRAGAQTIANNLVNVAATIRIVHWDSATGTNTPTGFDFTDYIRAGYIVARLRDHVGAIRPFELPPTPPVVSAPETSAVGDDGPVHRTDVGNARRLARRHGNDVRYVSRNWYVWDGTRYALDETGEIDRRAKDTARSILQEALSCTDDDMRGKLAAHSIASESAARIRAMVELAKSERPLAIPASMMDTDPWLLNCENGTYDFHHNALREHRRDDLMTMSTEQILDMNARAPRWEEFIARTFDNNNHVSEFVRRAVGYSLIGVTTEQVLFFCYGTGANGKSTFLETIRDVVGDYARNADFSTFATQRGGHSGPRNDIMRLRNARFVTAIEFDAGRALDEIVIKQLTGGDTISARRLYSESEEFRPTFTPWIAGNHKPIVKGTDEAIWRRLRLIPFNVTIPHGERNPRLRQELMEEAPGILRWAIEGAAAWKEIGLQPPDEVLIATQSYRNEMDTVEPFLEAKTVREDRASVKASVLYAEYKRWSEESGEDAISKTAFGLRMGEKGYESFNRGGAQFRRGVRIRSGDDMLLPDDPASTNGTNGTNNGEIHAIVEPFEPRSPNW